MRKYNFRKSIKFKQVLHLEFGSHPCGYTIPYLFLSPLVIYSPRSNSNSVSDIASGHFFSVPRMSTPVTSFIAFLTSLNILIDICFFKPKTTKVILFYNNGVCWLYRKLKKFLLHVNLPLVCICMDWFGALFIFVLQGKVNSFIMLSMQPIVLWT